MAEADKFLSWEDSENSSRGDCQEAGKLFGKFGMLDLMVEAVEQEGLRAVPASQGEVVHGVELGNLVATVVEDIRVTVVENFGFIVVRVGSTTSMGIEIKLMPDCLPGGLIGSWPMENLGATVLVVVATKGMQVKNDQMVASASVGVEVEESRKKICCNVVLLLLPSPDVAHSLPVAFCALAAEAAVMEGSRMYSGWLQASSQQWS